MDNYVFESVKADGCAFDGYWASETQNTYALTIETRAYIAVLIHIRLHSEYWFVQALDKASGGATFKTVLTFKEAMAIAEEFMRSAEWWYALLERQMADVNLMPNGLLTKNTRQLK